jgi:hypothetical protein
MAGAPTGLHGNGAGALRKCKRSVFIRRELAKPKHFHSATDLSTKARDTWRYWGLQKGSHGDVASGFLAEMG